MIILLALVVQVVLFVDVVIVVVVFIFVGGLVSVLILCDVNGRCARYRSC